MNEDLASIIVSILRRWWVVLIVGSVIIGGINWRVASTPAAYQSTILFALTPEPGLEQDDLLRALGLLNNDTVSATFADVLSSGATLDSAFAAIETSARQSDYSISATVAPESNVIRVQVDGPSRRTVEALHDSLRPIIDRLVQDIYSVFRIRYLSAPESSPARIEPPQMLALAVSIVIGIGAGSLLALWLDAILQHRRMEKLIDQELFDESNAETTARRARRSRT